MLATDQQLVHIITIGVSVCAFGFIPKMQSGRGCNSSIPFLYFLIVIPLSFVNVDACPIGPRTEKFARVAGKDEDSSAQDSEETMSEDERAALECAPYVERDSDVTGESPNDWDQSVGYVDCSLIILEAMVSLSFIEYDLLICSALHDSPLFLSLGLMELKMSIQSPRSAQLSTQRILL